MVFLILKSSILIRKPFRSLIVLVSERILSLHAKLLLITISYSYYIIISLHAY